MSGFTNFINKIAQAIGLSFVMFLIGAAGFQEQILGGAQVVSQPESATLMIRLIMAFAPLIFMSIGIIISYRYKIDAEKQKQIQDAIQRNEIHTEHILSSL
jgi:Na+/melibiose symporter-like transporter